ncbi:receptor-type protein kinase, putative [Bodo saltans]|uniref:Receptor-type protein kinase, putative n=1 Tax=Bodo saltans TaxID=75058 RepID=A0A0S4JSI0_BODSA|nr:receptor-type protein kinase, putative [Bodo saltans]|eukprot:CUG93154.1 receptor-type protein kinase, putative [Bodo saltans]
MTNNLLALRCLYVSPEKPVQAFPWDSHHITASEFRRWLSLCATKLTGTTEEWADVVVALKNLEFLDIRLPEGDTLFSETATTISADQWPKLSDLAISVYACRVDFRLFSKVEKLTLRTALFASRSTLSTMSLLRSIEISRCVGLETLFEALANIPTLEHVILTGDVNFFRAADFVLLRTLRQIQKLSFRGLHSIDDAALTEICTLPQLRNLEIQFSVGATNSGVRKLLALRELRTLDVMFWGNEISDRGIAYLAQLPKLEEISIKFNDAFNMDITNDGLQCLRGLLNPPVEVAWGRQLGRLRECLCRLRLSWLAVMLPRRFPWFAARYMQWYRNYEEVRFMSAVFCVLATAFGLLV